jgi:hypothetical protein
MKNFTVSINITWNESESSQFDTGVDACVDVEMKLDVDPE